MQAISQTIEVKNHTFSMVLPKSFTAKSVQVIVLPVTDAERLKKPKSKSSKKLSDYFGTLNPEEGEKVPLNINKYGIKVSPFVESLTGIIPNETIANDDYYDYLNKKYS